MNHYACSKDEAFLQDFLEILKRMLQNFYKILKKYLHGFESIVMYLAGSYRFQCNGILPFCEMMNHRQYVSIIFYECHLSIFRLSSS